MRQSGTIEASAEFVESNGGWPGMMIDWSVGNMIYARREDYETKPGMIVSGLFKKPGEEDDVAAPIHPVWPPLNAAARASASAALGCTVLEDGTWEETP